MGTPAKSMELSLDTRTDTTIAPGSTVNGNGDVKDLQGDEQKNAADANREKKLANERWTLPDKGLISVWIKSHPDLDPYTHSVFEYTNQNPDGLIQKIKLMISKEPSLQVYFQSDSILMGDIIHRFPHRTFRVTDHFPGKASEVSLSISIGTMRLEDFIPVKQYLESKGMPNRIVDDLEQFSCFRKPPALEQKFYQDVANLRAHSEKKAFVDLFEAAKNFLRHELSDWQRCHSDHLFILGSKCFDFNLLQYAYTVLKEISANSRFYDGAQFLMGKSLFISLQADNSAKARELKKNALKHFCVASGSFSEAEGFIQSLLANLCDRAMFDPRIIAMSTNDRTVSPDDKLFLKFLLMIDVCFEQQQQLHQKDELIEQLRLRINPADPEAQTLLLRFSSMQSNSERGEGEGLPADLRHKKRLVGVDPKIHHDKPEGTPPPLQLPPAAAAGAAAAYAVGAANGAAGAVAAESIVFSNGAGAAAARSQPHSQASIGAPIPMVTDGSDPGLK